MTRRLPAPCSTPGCAVITDQPHCPQHRHRRTGAWKKVRTAVLAASPRCACGAPAEEVDHVTPLADGGAELAPANLQAMCRRCHAAKTAIEA